jgi:predicted Fe-Mo cluster-binding NifX family protein
MEHGTGRMRRFRALGNKRRWTMLVCALLLVVPWAVLGLTRAKAITPSLIAVPVDAQDLSSPVAADFATARFFALVDLRTQRIEFVDNGLVRPRETLGLKAAYRLLERGVGAVVAQGIGLEARNALYSRGVRIFGAPTGSALGAVQLFSGGSLAEFAPPHGTGAPAGQPLAYPLPSMAGNGLGAGPVAAGGLAVSPPTYTTGAAQPNSWPGGYPPPAGQALAIVDPSLGVQGSSAPTGGVTVLGVRGSSRAERAGLRYGDVIVKLGQNQVRDVDQLGQLAPMVARSDPVPLLVARDGQFLQLWLPP